MSKTVELVDEDDIVLGVLVTTPQYAGRDRPSYFAHCGRSTRNHKRLLPNSAWLLRSTIPRNKGIVNLFEFKLLHLGNDLTEKHPSSRSRVRSIPDGEEPPGQDLRLNKTTAGSRPVFEFTLPDGETLTATSQQDLDEKVGRHLREQAEMLNG